MEDRNKIAVRATAEGFFGGARRRKGDVFFVPEGVIGKWFEPTDPTLAAINAEAIAEATRAKLAAEEKARQDIADAKQNLDDTTIKANQSVTNAKAEADEVAKKSIFGGLLGNREVKPEVEKPEGEKTQGDGSDLA